MLDNERIIMEILDLAQDLEIEDLRGLIDNLEVLLENKEESEEDDKLPWERY